MLKRKPPTYNNPDTNKSYTRSISQFTSYNRMAPTLAPTLGRHEGAKSSNKLSKPHVYEE